MALVVPPTISGAVLQVDAIHDFLLACIQVVGGTMNGAYYPPAVTAVNLQAYHFDLEQEAEQGTVGTLVVPPLDGAVLADDIVVTGMEVKVLSDFPAHLPGAGAKVYVVSAASHPLLALPVPDLAGSEQKTVSTNGYPAGRKMDDLYVPMQRGTILRLAGVDADGAALSRAALDCISVLLRYRADMKIIV